MPRLSRLLGVLLAAALQPAAGQPAGAEPPAGEFLGTLPVALKRGDGQIEEQIALHAGDDPLAVAQAFTVRVGVSDAYVEPLATNIREYATANAFAHRLAAPPAAPRIALVVLAVDKSYADQRRLGQHVVRLSGDPEVTQWSLLDKFAYAQRHGYALIVETRRADETRATPWSKIVLMQKYLDQFDWVAMVDVDVLFLRKDVPLETWLDHGRPTSPHIIGGFEPNPKYHVNTGFLIARNSTFTHDLLARVYAMPEEGMEHWEQTAFNRIIDADPSLLSGIRIMDESWVDYPVKNERIVQTGSPFATHFSSCSGPARVESCKIAFQRFFERAMASQ